MSALRIYVFSCDRGGYDSYSGFVVVAESETAARALIQRCGDECRHSYAEPERGCVWHDPTITPGTVIGDAAPGVEAGIVLDSFHAG